MEANSYNDNFSSTDGNVNSNSISTASSANTTYSTSDQLTHVLATLLNINCSAEEHVIHSLAASEAASEVDSAMHNGLFHLAHACFLISFLSPSNRYSESGSTVIV